MALLSVIRRWHYRDHLSIREIAKRTGLFISILVRALHARSCVRTSLRHILAQRYLS